MAIRDISDDNDELRVLSQHGGKYPYTYPFYYAEYSSPRDLADNVSERDMSDPEA